LTGTATNLKNGSGYGAEIPPDYKSRYSFFLNEYVRWDAEIPKELKEEFSFLQNLMAKHDLSNAIDSDFANAEISKEDKRKLERSKYKIDLNKELPPPQKAWTLDDAILGTLGNFGLIIGKAKSKKSFFINIAVTTAISDEKLHGRFKGHLPLDRPEVLYFDTEMDEYDVQKAGHRVRKQIGYDKQHLLENLHIHFLRGLSPKERLAHIEEEIYSNDRASFVVIDGIRDLITAINDEEQATMMASKLLRWTQERNIYIIVVLHQNKGDHNARGHIGTELINKAQTVLSVSVDKNNKDISVVAPEMCRDKEPDIFAFRINEYGLPEEVAGYTTDEKTAVAFDLENINKATILRTIFAPEENADGIRFADLFKYIVAAVKTEYDVKIGENKAKEILKSAKDNGLLYQDVKQGPYKFREPI
jgi:hypothetical protein